MNQKVLLWLVLVAAPTLVSPLARTQNQPRVEERGMGRKLFLQNCASCHGVNGDGRGIVSPALRKQPTDLTRIPLRDGKFPSEALVRVIVGELALPVHGQREMPVWGNILSHQEVKALVRHLESIQNPIGDHRR